MTTAVRFFDDLAVGDRLVGAPFLLTQEDIIAFARAFDPQPQHIDPQAAAAGPFGTVIASGWHLTALAMRDYVNAWDGAQTLGLGVRDLRWLLPARAGDLLTVTTTVTALRPSNSRPDYGIVDSLFEIHNQRNETVMRQISAALMLRRAPTT